MIGHNQEQLTEALVTCIQHGQTAKRETKHTHKNRDRALFGKRNLQESPLAFEPTHKKTETGSTTYEKRSVTTVSLIDPKKPLTGPISMLLQNSE
ncbi:hypothetical protein F2Q69_00056647 [Brassica cretica]|uniref:Uncharacterized protein n=1 Tax=Brassica cretica TaxID=69181 RepID=A0A8S9N1U2_BRACR|nr:hypothetical protein F2Q69_00056647 [Brassica cretica]